MSGWKIDVAAPGELEAVIALLAGAHLPTSGISEGFPGAYSVARRDGTVVGVAGLETYGKAGLLRSVAVHGAVRGSGIGRLLVQEQLRKATELGMTAVYLLTTTAPDYFRRIGFSDVARASAPAELQRSAEFAAICPASALCLAKWL
jgi:amino-acid N-acetyltransferase